MRAAGVNAAAAFGNNNERRNLFYADSLSSNIIRSWLETMSQFRHETVQRSTMFLDARYNIFLSESSFVNDGLFFVIFRN